MKLFLHVSFIVLKFRMRRRNLLNQLEDVNKLPVLHRIRNLTHLQIKHDVFDLLRVARILP